MTDFHNKARIQETHNRQHSHSQSKKAINEHKRAKPSCSEKRKSTRLMSMILLVYNTDKQTYRDKDKQIHKEIKLPILRKSEKALNTANGPANQVEPCSGCMHTYGMHPENCSDSKGPPF